MVEWINAVFDNPNYGLLVLPAATLLGITASVGSCCNVAVVGALTGFAGTTKDTNRSVVIVTGLSFMIGTILALAAMGAVAGFVSQVAGSLLGKYWTIFAGLAAILFGLVSLNLIPFKMPQFSQKTDRKLPQSFTGAILFGGLVGGGSAACSVGCNPALATALGMAVVRGQTVWGIIILILFAIGYSLPMTAALVGLSYGKLAFLRSEKMSRMIRYAGGVILLTVGFYFLTTV